MTPREAKRELEVSLCECGKPKLDHDFGFGGNDENGCPCFRPADPSTFARLVEIFHEGRDVFSPSSFVSR